MDTLTGKLALVGWSQHRSKSLEDGLQSRRWTYAHFEDLQALRTAQVAVALVRASGADAPGIPPLEAMHALKLDFPIIVIGDQLRPEQVVEATRLGALDVLLEPVPLERMLDTLGEARCRFLGSQAGDVLREDCPVMLGSSQQIINVYKSLGVAASNDLSVLLTGETGVGKEVSANCIHRHSARSGKPFVAINCTAIPEGLLEAELFGHARGAFTNAVEEGIGKIEAAKGGTLLLDEIGDMPLSFQAKLLRFLDNRTFHRLGDACVRDADVRIIAATNRDLLVDVEAGRFRRDLLYRLAQFPIKIPPLRERPQDIIVLIRAFLAEANLKLGLYITDISSHARSQAMSYHWPGNVRELRNVVLQSAIRTRSGVINHLDLPAQHSADVDTGMPQGLDFSSMIERAIAGGTVRTLLEQFEAQTVRKLLDSFEGNRSRVAEALGVSRNTLRARMKTLGLEDANG